MTKRVSLDGLDVAARAKAAQVDPRAAAIRVPLDVDKLKSIIAVTNLKGGVGKSTVAVNLACELATRQKVVLVDADAQGTAAEWGARASLPIRVERMPLESAHEVEAWVQGVLAIESSHIVIDCPPHVGPATCAAAGLADIALVPVTPSGADLMATIPALALLESVQQARRDDGPLCMLVPNKVDRRTAVGREITAALGQFAQPIAPPLHQATALVDAFNTGLSVAQYAPRSRAAREFRDLATAVKRRWLMELRAARQAAEETREEAPARVQAGS